jgi:release factor glutamine methyltransferase
MNIRDAVTSVRDRLVRAGIEPGEAALDAELLAREVLGWDLARYIAHSDEPASDSFVTAFEALVRRRERREPMSLILGRREFWGLEFEVTGDVLTPRPETEIIVEEALAQMRCGWPEGSPQRRRRPADGPRLLFADVGTGCGCLAVTLAREVREARVVATDVSGAALEVARRNARRHGVAHRVAFVQSSLLDGVGAAFDLIVSNPPYVPTDLLATLPPEVREHEPRLALDGGPDGLDAIRGLMAQAAIRLTGGGHLVVEFGVGQESGVTQAAARWPGLQLQRIRRDLQAIPRTAVLTRRLDASAPEV